MGSSIQRALQDIRTLSLHLGTVPMCSQNRWKMEVSCEVMGNNAHPSILGKIMQYCTASFCASTTWPRSGSSSSSEAAATIAGCAGAGVGLLMRCRTLVVIPQDFGTGFPITSRFQWATEHSITLFKGFASSLRG